MMPHNDVAVRVDSFYIQRLEGEIGRGSERISAFVKGIAEPSFYAAAPLQPPTAARGAERLNPLTLNRCPAPTQPWPRIRFTGTGCGAQSAPVTL
jgi:hypothetical protein